MASHDEHGRKLWRLDVEWMDGRVEHYQKVVSRAAREQFMELGTLDGHEVVLPFRNIRKMVWRGQDAQ